MNKDQIKGQAKQAKGGIKEATGKLVGNESLQHKGAAENATGKVQKGYGDTKEAVKDKT